MEDLRKCSIDGCDMRTLSKVQSLNSRCPASINSGFNLVGGTPAANVCRVYRLVPLVHLLGFVESSLSTFHLSRPALMTEQKQDDLEHGGRLILTIRTGALVFDSHWMLNTGLSSEPYPNMSKFLEQTRFEDHD